MIFMWIVVGVLGVGVAALAYAVIVSGEREKKQEERLKLLEAEQERLWRSYGKLPKWPME